MSDFKLVKLIDPIQIVMPAGAVPDGVNAGDIIRWNAGTSDWEVTAEPFEFQGIVLTPALAALADAVGGMYFNSTEKAVMVCTEV